MKKCGYSLDELNTMLPWEREIYRAMLIEELQESEKSE